jgi:Spherulation-specific family 4
VTTLIVLTGLATVACASVSAVSLQPVSGEPSMVAVAAAAVTSTTSASGSQKATVRHAAKHRASPSKSASSPSPTPSASATTPSPSPSPSHTTAPPTPAPTEPATSSGCQQSFVPSYFYSGTLWDQVIGTSPRPATMFLNVDNGVGTAPVAHFQQLVKSAQQNGITVLGYSSTEYATRPIAQVEAEVADYKAWYGVNGIMLDTVQGTSGALSYYQQLYNYIHSEIPGAIIWLNPGSFPTSSFMSVANVIMVFEGPYTSFESDSVPSWVNDYSPDRFAQVVYDTPESDLSSVVSQSLSRRAGNLFATDLGEPNPYGALPSYWSTEAGTVAAQC